MFEKLTNTDVVAYGPTSQLGGISIFYSFPILSVLLSLLFRVKDSLTLTLGSRKYFLLKNPAIPDDVLIPKKSLKDTL